MSKQSIYLDDYFETKIRNIAQKEGRSISEVIRKRVEMSFEYERKKISVQNLENQINAVYAVLEILAGEVAYVSGATVESTKSHENIHLAALRNSEKIQKVINLIRSRVVDDIESNII